MEQEWIPRLVADEVVASRLNYKGKITFAAVEFYIPLKNVGKCDIFYEVRNFDLVVEYSSAEFEGDFSIEAHDGGKKTFSGVLPFNASLSQAIGLYWSAPIYCTILKVSLAPSQADSGMIVCAGGLPAKLECGLIVL